MKLVLLALLVCVSSAFAAEPLKFVVVTKDTEWPDGLSSRVGDVEIVASEDAQNFILWDQNGKRYPIAKSSVKETTAEDAALRLMYQRRELMGEISALQEKVVASAPAPETARDRMRARKADRAAKAREAEDNYIRWRLLFGR